MLPIVYRAHFVSLGRPCDQSAHDESQCDITHRVHCVYHVHCDYCSAHCPNRVHDAPRVNCAQCVHDFFILFKPFVVLIVHIALFVVIALNMLSVLIAFIFLIGVIEY